MKFTMSGFNQKKLIEFGLDLKDAALLRYFIDFKDTNSMSMIIVDNKPYYWVKYEHLKNDLPILGINNNDALRRRLKKLESAGILGHYHKLEEGSYSYYCVGDNYKNLLVSDDEIVDFNNYTPPTQKSHPSDQKVVPLRLKSRNKIIHLLKINLLKIIIKKKKRKKLNLMLKLRIIHQVKI